MADQGYWFPKTPSHSRYTAFNELNTGIDGTQIAEINEALDLWQVGVFTYNNEEYVAKVTAGGYSATKWRIITTVYKSSNGSLFWTRTDYVDKTTASIGPGGFDTAIDSYVHIINDKLCIPEIIVFYTPSGLSSDPGYSYPMIVVKLHTIDFTGENFVTNTINYLPVIYQVSSSDSKYYATFLINGSYYKFQGWASPVAPQILNSLRYLPRVSSCIYFSLTTVAYRLVNEPLYEYTQSKPMCLIFGIKETTGTTIRLGSDSGITLANDTLTINSDFVITEDSVYLHGYRSSWLAGVTTYYEKGLIKYDISTGLLVSYDSSNYDIITCLYYNKNTTTNDEYIAGLVNSAHTYIFKNGLFDQQIAYDNSAASFGVNLVNYGAVNLLIFGDKVTGYIRCIDLSSDSTPYNWFMNTGTQTEYKFCVGALGDMFLIKREAVIEGVNKLYISGVTFQGNNLFNIDITGNTVNCPFFGKYYLYAANGTKTLVIWKQEHTGNFWVESTDPEDNDINIPVNYPIKIEFNLDPDVTTITEDSLTIKIGDVAYEYYLVYPGSGVYIYLKTIENFLPSSHIDVSLTADIKSEADGYDLEAYDFDFNTAADGPSGETPPDAPGVPTSSAGLTSPTGPEQGANKYRQIQRSSYGELDEREYTE